MRTNIIVAVGCLLSLALVLITLSCTPVPATQRRGRQSTATPNGPVTPGPSARLTATPGAPIGRYPTPARTRDLAPEVANDVKITVIVRHHDGSYEWLLLPWDQYPEFEANLPPSDIIIDYVPPEPLRHKVPPPSPQGPTVTPDLAAWPFAAPTCTENPAGVTLTVTERPGQIPSPTGEGSARSFSVQGAGFIPGENVTINVSGHPTVPGSRGSTTATVGADTRFATTVSPVISQEKMPLDVFVSHSRGLACVTIQAEQ